VPSFHRCSLTLGGPTGGRANAVYRACPVTLKAAIIERCFVNVRGPSYSSHGGLFQTTENLAAIRLVSGHFSLAVNAYDKSSAQEIWNTFESFKSS
jgi:hypothetical protein